MPEIVDFVWNVLMFGLTEIKLPKASELSGSRGVGISPFCKSGFISEAASRVLAFAKIVPSLKQ